MLFLIPTAKEMKTSQAQARPQLSSLSQAIIDQLLTYSPDDLAKLYKIKEPAAQKEWDRIQALKEAPHFPAIQLFNGLMYRQIKRQDLTAAEASYLADRVYITSSLYGIIPALTPIAEHRLDFNVPLKVQDQSLKQAWRPHYDRFLEDQEQPLVSLLSSEFEDVFSPSLRDKLIKTNFMERREGKLKTHSTISKKARGHFLTAALEAGATSLQDLKNLTFAGFSYQAELSSDQELVFIKDL